MEIKPIRNDEDYEAALTEIERLFDADAGSPEADKLEVLTTLVEAYEEKNYSIPLPDPIEAISYYMESRGLSRKDLEQYIGSRGKGIGGDEPETPADHGDDSQPPRWTGHCC